MKIIIYPSFKEDFDNLENKKGSLPIYGRIYDEFSVCHLLGITKCPGPEQSIGYLTFGAGTFEKGKRTNKYPMVIIRINSQDIEDIKVDIHGDNGEIKTDIDIDIVQINLNRLFVRIDEKETPLKILQKKKVIIIGMGSGGSLLAVYLAKSGVKNFIFIDDDILETHNIIRHVCDLSQLGRYKTKAVKDYIKDRIPKISIKTVEKQFSIHTKADAEYYLDLFNKSDLIIAASGEHLVNFALNDFIYSNKLLIPTIYAGTFEGIKGGLMFKVDPRLEDYCYHCIYSDPNSNGDVKTGSIPTTKELEQRIIYDRTLQEQLAQPGLGLDIDNLTILLSKFCLDILLTGKQHGLYHFTHNFYMWFNRDILNKNETDTKFEGLELYYYENLEKNLNCPYHGAQMVNESSNNE